MEFGRWSCVSVHHIYFRCSRCQKEHVRASVVDLFERYRPPVKAHRYKVKFVPVFDTQAEGEKFAKQV